MIRFIINSEKIKYNTHMGKIIVKLKKVVNKKMLFKCYLNVIFFLV